MPEKVSFFHGKEENVAQAIADGKINGSDFVVTSDTDNLIYVNKEQVGEEEKLVQHILGSAKTKKPLTVNLGKDGALGGFSTNDTISAGTSLDDIIKKLLVKRIPAIYDSPTVNIACKQAGRYEVGTDVSVGVTGVFTQKDGGAITKWQITKNSTVVAERTNLPIEHTETLHVPDGNTKYQVKVEYAQGAVKPDNLGEDSPNGRIEAGSVASSISTIVGFRNAFYGAGVGDPVIATSDNIRALGHSIEATKKKVFDISVPKGQQYIVFAYPKSLGEVTEVMYVEQNDHNMKSAFTVSEVEVCGAAAEKDATPYSVYSYKMAVPSGASMMTFRVTI